MPIRAIRGLKFPFPPFISAFRFGLYFPFDRIINACYRTLDGRGRAIFPVPQGRMTVRCQRHFPPRLFDIFRRQTDPTPVGRRCRAAHDLSSHPAPPNQTPSPGIVHLWPTIPALAAGNQPNNRETHKYTVKHKLKSCYSAAPFCPPTRPSRFKVNQPDPRQLRVIAGVLNETPLHRVLGWRSNQIRLNQGKLSQIQPFILAVDWMRCQDDHPM